MPRAKKVKPDQPTEETGVTATPLEGPEASSTGEERPSQLNQIRAAISTPAGEPDEAPASTEAVEPPAEPVAAEPVAWEPAAAEAAPEPPSEPAPPEPAPAAVVPVFMPPPPVGPPPGAPVTSSAYAARAARPSSSLALGIVLVVVGVFFLVIRMFDIDLSTYGWPLYVIIPGLTLLVVGFVSLGTGALIPGGIITMAGLVLAYQNSTGDWASWSYAWALVLPGGVGLGLYLQGLREHESKLIRQGRTLMFWALLIFMIGFVLFESILNISGIDYGTVGRAALPVLLIVIGVTLLVRSIQSGGRADGPKT